MNNTVTLIEPIDITKEVEKWTADWQQWARNNATSAVTKSSFDKMVEVLKSKGFARQFGGEQDDYHNLNLNGWWCFAWFHAASRTCTLYVIKDRLKISEVENTYFPVDAAELHDILVQLGNI